MAVLGTAIGSAVAAIWVTTPGALGERELVA